MSSNLETQDFYQDHRKLATCHSTQVKKKVEEDKKKKTIKVTSFVIFPIINSL